MNGRRSNSGQELFDLAQDRVLVAEIREADVAESLDCLGVRNVRAEVTTARSMGDVSRLVDHECRDSNGGQKVSHIDTGIMRMMEAAAPGLADSRSQRAAVSRDAGSLPRPGCSPTTPPWTGSSAPSSWKPTTNGESPTAATSPRPPWPDSARTNPRDTRVHPRTTTPRRLNPVSVGDVPALPDLDLARIHHYCDSRVPPRLRDEARVEATHRGKNVTIYDCRPPWHPQLKEWSRVPVAQLRYDTAHKHWTLYYADRNSRWHRYDLIDPGTVDQLLEEIDNDPTGIFWG